MMSYEVVKERFMSRLGDREAAIITTNYLLDKMYEVFQKVKSPDADEQCLISAKWCRAVLDKAGLSDLFDGECDE
jgi:hypothetical protein